MASYSEVKAGLDEIAQVIREKRAVLLKAKTNAADASAALDTLPATYAGVIATIEGYGTTDAAEALAKAELATLTAEFIAVKGVADDVAGISP